MPPTPFDPVLWLGAALLAGAAGAWLAGAVRAPMAAGALAAGWCAAVLPAPPHDPSLGIRWVIAALLGMLLGAEMASGRSLPRALLAALPGTCLAAAAVGGASLLLGFAAGDAALLAAALAAGSPLAAMAVAGETRARGETTRSLLSVSLASFYLAAAALAVLRLALDGDSLPVAAAGGSLLLAAACGAAILIPLSRAATQAETLICAGIGCALLAAVATRLAASETWIVPMAAVAGWMTASFTPGGERLRDTLRRVSVPAAVAWFALAGATLGRAPRPAEWGTALALAAARGCGLALRGAAGRRAEGVPGILARLPSWSAAAALPAMAAGTARLLPVLLLAGGLSELIGMAAARWELARAGEAAGPDDQPEAWRARMR